MSSLKTILVVDDQAVNRAILLKILSEKYAVLEAEDGRAALALLAQHGEKISAVMLDLVMPIMDGYAVLTALQNDEQYHNLPVVVTTDHSDSESEITALKLGAWDFVSKPYNSEIIRFRVKNVIARSELSALQELKYLAEYDALTGLYNKNKFFAATRAMLDEHPDLQFSFLRFDVDRFHLINSFFGTAEGDKLLLYIARQMAADAQRCTHATYGRIESDVVALCVPNNEVDMKAMLVESKKTLAKFNPNYDIVPSIGIYIIDDAALSVEEMYNRATLAAKTCKGNYVDFYAYYSAEMSAALAAEQAITNDMNYALEHGEFLIYLQPQYNVRNNALCGAEALVRWQHPQKGLLAPAAFIPVFERNGFITKLDYYVWELACQCLRRWIEEGVEPYPLSVNVSRVSVYNPNLVETLLDLVKKYQLTPSLLNLELTESAYTDNPAAMKKVMKQLQEEGFTLMMDDFGSGYSSLALLKDIAINILKIDMKFLSDTDLPGRGENIIASVIRMAKWLNIPVVAEGAETAEQVEFLRSVGCDFVQGYYFARPMPVAEYEQLCRQLPLNAHTVNDKHFSNYRYDDLFSLNREMKALFSNPLQAAAIYEFANDKLEMVRVNEAYYALLGHDDMLAKSPDILSLVELPYRNAVLSAFRACVSTGGTAECDYMRLRRNGTQMWLHAKLRYASAVGGQHILIGELTDITMRRELDFELQKYRSFLLEGSREPHKVLIVDDAEINRIVLKKILQDEFLFLEAENGAQAIDLLHAHPGEIDLILLDISMPVMDGKEFLQYKKSSPELDAIPAIVITADDSPQQQISTFSLGANDYLVKPFIAEVVRRRIKNVLEANSRFKDMVREYNSMSEQVKTDLMTGLINRVSAEEMMTQRLASTTAACAMIMLDIDNFKKINDSCGHDYGDKVICAVANKLRLMFRKEDVIARMGGDEFAVFIGDLPNTRVVEAKAHELCESMSAIKISGGTVEVTCSAGIAISDPLAPSFATLYQNADKALYYAKCHGRNTVSIYGEKSTFQEAGEHEAQ